MNVVYALQPLVKGPSIFLAGPTPRREGVASWRPVAIGLFEKMGYEGTLYVPEPADGRWLQQYDDQVEWEHNALRMASAIMFWIPRDMATMPALTTNDEWGYWKHRHPGKLVLGCPHDAPHTRYQRYWAEKLYIPYSATLVGACAHAMGISDAS